MFSPCLPINDGRFALSQVFTNGMAEWECGSLFILEWLFYFRLVMQYNAVTSEMIYSSLHGTGWIGRLIGTESTTAGNWTACGLDGVTGIVNPESGVA